MDIRVVLVLFCAVAFASCKKDEAGHKGVTPAGNSTKAKHESDNKAVTAAGNSSRIIGMPPIDALFNNKNQTTRKQGSNPPAQPRWKNLKPSWLVKNKCCKCEDDKETSEAPKHPVKGSKAPNNANTTSIQVGSKVTPAPNKANTTAIKLDAKVDFKGANGTKPTKV